MDWDSYPEPASPLRVFIGIVARIITWVAIAIIVIDAVVSLWQDGNYILSVLAAILFPATVFIWPWTHSLWGVSLIIVFAIAVVAYPISTFVGRLPPIT